MKFGWGVRPVRKNPSFSLICAKCTADGRCPFSSGPKACDGADWHTCTLPSRSPSMADFPAGATECFGANPSAFKNPPAMVAINGV